ncbi:MAG: hypothetical protein FJ125_11280, partial [Deltaproteobacteria bacterium]|nr:hypothetical protein [Deltaproteobacteria bacterium]
LHDLDGDGLADLCARTAEGFHCHLAQGDGFAPALAGPALADGSGWRDHDNYGTIRLGDVDGDGRSDLCARANAGVYCWLFDGQGFGRRIDGPELSDDSGWGDWRYNTSLRLGDIDGDGRADLCARAAAGIRCWPSTGAGFGGSLAGPAYNDANGWDRPPYLGTLRLATRPCAGQEACNGRDDDCDGEVDEELSRPCSSPCGDGEERCAGGAWGACSAPAPGEERCNGADDDCDGEVDEELGRACSSPCGDGVESCTDGAWGGCSAPLPGEERCNGEDDDCDGEVDEGCACRPGESEACGSVVGLCQAGRRICREEEGVWGPCLGGVGPEAEACGNGADDDCDGEVDEGCACAVGSERACRVEGRCGEGVQRCLDGAWGECLVPAAADAVADCGEPDASPDGGEGPGTWPAGEESLAGGCTCRMGPGRGPDLRLGPPATASEPALLPLPRLLQLLLLLPLLLLPRCRRGRADGRRPAAVGASGDHPADRARAGWPRRAPAVLLALLLLPLPLLLLLLLAAGPAHAAPRITRFRLVGITRQEVQRHQLHRLLEPLLGRPATGETLREAILIVDRTQAFGHGQAELEQLGSGRALAELRFTSLPRRIDQLLFAREGWRDDPALGKQVEKLLRSRALSLDSRLGATYHPFLVDLDREKLVTIFQEQGYLDVQIRHRALRHQRLVRLVFRVELGQQVAVREVRFSGTARPPAELLKLIQTQPGKNGLLGAPRLVRARLETDVQQLTEHFRRLGYKDASITVREQRVAPTR